VCATGRIRVINMNAADILQVLEDEGIPCYGDSCNPDFTVHFDYKDRAFYFDNSFFVDNEPWELIEIGPSTVLGKGNTKEELLKLLEKI
jgi:hypothetical protein